MIQSRRDSLLGAFSTSPQDLCVKMNYKNNDNIDNMICVEIDIET